MKKILLATTILSMSAGFAAADVAVSGDARMGMVYAKNGFDAATGTAWGANENTTSFTSRVRIAFAASGASDSGVTFGASIRADNAAGGAAGAAGSAFVSGAFGTLSMGDVGSAFNTVYGNIAGVGMTGLGDFNDIGDSADGGAFATLGSTTGAAAFKGMASSGTVYDEEAQALGDDNSPVYVGQIGAPFNSLYNGLFELDADNQYIYTDGALEDLADTLEGMFGGQFSAAAFLDSFDVDSNDDILLSSEDFVGAIAEGFGSSMSDDGDSNLIVIDGFDTGDLALDEQDDYVKFEDIRKLAITAKWDIKPIDAKVLYQFAQGDFSAAAGYSQLGDDTAYSLAGSYTSNGLKLSVGYARADWNDAATFSLVATGLGNAGGGLLADNTDTDTEGSLPDGSRPQVTETLLSHSMDASAIDMNLGVAYTTGAVTVSGVYQQREFSLDGTEVDQQDTKGVSIAYTTGALGLTAYASQTDSSITETSSNASGIGASYDLGGGTKLTGGLVNSENLMGEDNTAADFGITMAF